MKGIIDRFEGEFVVIEVDGETRDIPRAEVHPDVKVNDAVVVVDGIWIVDEQETVNRNEQIKKLMDQVWEDE